VKRSVPESSNERNHLDLIPAVFSVGYGGGILAHDRNLAEGLPVEDAPFLVKGGEARFVATNSAQIVNGGFEKFTGNKLSGFGFHDQPGEVSFVDAQVKHSGQVSLRLENFTSNPYGHGRVMQAVPVQPHRCYRVTIWVKTESLQPAGVFRLLALADMFDPNHNAHGNYYLVEGDFTGSWQHVPKDLVMAVWGGEPREKSLRFIAGQGFSTLVACCYDAGDLNEVRGWLQLARQTPDVRGFMYTPWQRKYSLLPASGDLLAPNPGPSFKAQGSVFSLPCSPPHPPWALHAPQSSRHFTVDDLPTRLQAHVLAHFSFQHFSVSLVRPPSRRSRAKYLAAFRSSAFTARWYAWSCARPLNRGCPP
jgi:hypothetical protein